MIAYPLPQPTQDASLLDVMPWLMSLPENEIAFEMAMAWYWIDPIGSDFISEWDVESELGAACLYAAYSSMPDVYGELVDAYWRMDDAQFSSFAHGMLQPHFPAEGIYQDEPETFYYLPYEALGASPEYGEWASAYDNARTIAPLMEPRGFVLDAEFNCWQEVSDAAVRNRANELILQSLEAQPDPVYCNVAMALRWVTKSTGNTLTDWTYEELAETGVDYITWDNLDFAWEVQLEAYDFMEQIYAGLAALAADPVLANAFAANYQTVYRSIASETDHTIGKLEDFLNGYICSDIQWPEYHADGNTGYTESQVNAYRLRVWRDTPYRKYELRS